MAHTVTYHATTPRPEPLRHNQGDCSRESSEPFWYFRFHSQNAENDMTHKLSLATKTSPARIALQASAWIGAIISSSAWAQFDSVRLYGANPGHDGGVFGAVVMNSPEYSGASDRRLMALPILDYQWKDGWFAGTSNGLGRNFSGKPSQQYGLRLTADLGRPENRSPALDGLGSIHPRPEIGAFFNQYFSRELFVTSSLRYGSGEQRDGLQLDLSAGYTRPFADHWRFAVGVATSFANSGYMQSYYGVSPEQAARSGYAVFHAGGGLREVRLNGSLSYRFTERLGATLALSGGQLHGDAQASPITARDNNASLVFAMTQAF
jgi:outer membrane scaffolding protein for murein synthesis (MipA/OmpV family)